MKLNMKLKVRIKAIIFTLLFTSLYFHNSFANQEMPNAKSLSKQEIKHMIESNVIKQPSAVNPSRLKMLTISYYDFSGQERHDGKMVVFDCVADYVLNIFYELHRIKFPIAKMELMDIYNGDDELAMESNNTSSLNQRNITNQNLPSLHSYGLAIDINPVQNPFIQIDNDAGTAIFLPKSGIKFANRKENRINKASRIGMAEEVVKIFYQNGFDIWGGDWDDPIDYQHFQISRALATRLISADSEDAKKIFDEHVKSLNSVVCPKI